MRSWIATASAEHVRVGRASGFMQVCHGKAAPLRRLLPGDAVVYYSPSETFGKADGYRHFTAFGHVLSGDPYQVEMQPSFTPYRRNVKWCDALETPITPLLDQLEITRGKRNWGYPFRFGLVEISQADMALIASHMHVDSYEE